MNSRSEDGERTRPLLIVGNTVNASDVAVRRLLRGKNNGQAVVVVDYHGGLATHLTGRNKGNLHKGPVAWCDLVNRRRPTAVFRFKQSPGMIAALRAFLLATVQHLAQPVSVQTIDHVVGLAHRLAAHGYIGLGALVNSLRRPELIQPLRRLQCSAAELDCLVSTLEWMLRFPSLWAASEGNNVLDFSRALSSGTTVWVEMNGSHLERVEHQLLARMIDAALLDAVLSVSAKAVPAATVRPGPMILYGRPPACPLLMATPELKAKQIGLFSLNSRWALPEAAQAWLDADADCWVAGPLADLSEKSGWLDERERDRVQRLQAGEVWVRSGASKKAVTTVVRSPEISMPLADNLRRQALKGLRLTPVKQFCSAIARGDGAAPVYTDLYATICTKATLYAGWFRVKGHNRQSYGHDRVTIEQFGNVLDQELDKLARELTEGSYRCRPLRTVRIPKADGDERILHIACVRDRVVQAACLHAIEPLFDARFSRSSFAYRPGRGAHHAVALARSAIRSGKAFVVMADIRKCFDTIDHDILLRLVGDVIGDRDLIRLLRQWLAADVIDFMEILPTEIGVPQGEAISPLLANIYLDPLDKEFERAGYTFVRYADDYLVLCESEAEAAAALNLMREFLQSVLRLTLKPAKTQHCHIREGVQFLGFTIEQQDVRIPEAKLAHIAEALARHAATITADGVAPTEKWRVVLAMNALIRGVRNYFLIDDAPSVRKQLGELDEALRSMADAARGEDAASKLFWSACERFLVDGKGESEPTTVDIIASSTGAYLHTDNSGSTVDPALLSVDRRSTSRPLAGTTAGASPAPNTAADADADAASLFIDGRLHVMTSGCYVTFSGDDVVVRRRKTEVGRAAIADVKMVYLEGKGIALSADLTMRLCEQDVPVVFTPLVGRPAAIAQSVQSLRSNVRQQQVLRKNDPDILKAGLRMLAAKVANQASVLKYFARYRKRTGDALFHEATHCADDLRTIADTLDSLDPASAGARAVGMGHEGRAAAKYWSMFGQLIPSRIPFPGRQTRHAVDPVNSAINYVYSLLYGEVWRSVVRAGLDPYFGIVHGTERDQGSLVFDLIEEFRAPFGDRLVLGMLGRGFSLDLDKEGRLLSSCRRKIVSAFHKQWRRGVRWRGKLRTPGEVLEIQAAGLRKAFAGVDDYRPFRFQW